MYSGPDIRRLHAGVIVNPPDFARM